MNATIERLIKGVVGVVVLLILFSVVTRWWGQYREAVQATARETTQTAAPAAEETKTAEGKPAKRLVVLTEGLNFRKEPNKDSERIRGLKKNERLTLVKSQKGWYYVEDSNETRGWISSNKAYTKVVK